MWWWWPTAWHEDDWFDERPGQDVVPGVRWWPGITGLQLLADMFVAGSDDVPLGYGHNYGEGYVDAFAWVTGAELDDGDLARLRETIAATSRPG
ncbi:alpha/beta-hydrolase family protein [Serinibacter arcticus]|uniref:alpha/beta-hydrolase family protein n=1 Tax=Serinibacter arcticus TaxID=1655435 RepID=UPI003AF32A3B